MPSRNTFACGTCRLDSASTLARALSSCREPRTTLSTISSATMTPVETSPIAKLTIVTATSMMFIGSRSCARATAHTDGRLLRRDPVRAGLGEPIRCRGRGQTLRSGRRHVPRPHPRPCARTNRSLEKSVHRSRSARNSFLRWRNSAAIMSADLVTSRWSHCREVDRRPPDGSGAGDPGPRHPPLLLLTLLALLLLALLLVLLLRHSSPLVKTPTRLIRITDPIGVAASIQRIARRGAPSSKPSPSTTLTRNSGRVWLLED